MQPLVWGETNRGGEEIPGTEKGGGREEERKRKREKERKRLVIYNV